MKIIKILLILNALWNVESRKEMNRFPTKRWMVICRSSNITYWYRNKTLELSDYLKENMDALYM